MIRQGSVKRGQGFTGTGTLCRTVLDWVDSTAFLVALYAIAGAMSVVLGLAERRRRSSDDPRLWPTFWFVTGALLLVMAAGRAANVSDLLTEIGREQARSEGWYETRRSLQAWVIGGVAAGWAVTVAIAVWRVPERRRRYLPTAIAVFTLVCFVGIRLISLHQVDALLYRREVQGAIVGAVIEVGLLLVVMILMVGPARRLPRPISGRSAPQVEPTSGARITT